MHRASQRCCRIALTVSRIVSQGVGSQGVHINQPGCCDTQISILTIRCLGSGIHKNSACTMVYYALTLECYHWIQQNRQATVKGTKTAGSTVYVSLGFTRNSLKNIV